MSTVSVDSKEKSEARKQKMKRNIMTLIVSRCMQGRVDVPQPQREHLEQIESLVNERLDMGNVTDTHICTLAVKLRKILVEQSVRSESAPPPVIEDCLPPIESYAPSRVSTPKSIASQHASTLLLTDNTISKSTKPAVVRRREMLISDAAWHKAITDDMGKFAREQKSNKELHKEKMQMCKQSLDDQVQHNNRIKEQTKRTEKQYAEEEFKRREQWHKEESDKMKRKRSFLAREKAERITKLEEEREAKKMKDEQSKQEELAYRRRLEQEELQQMKCEANKKMANTKEYRVFMEFNRSELDKKRKELEEEKVKDKEILKEHASLLEKQEQSRMQILKRAEKKMPGNDFFFELHHKRLAKQRDQEAKVEHEVKAIDTDRARLEARRKYQAEERKKEFIDTLGQQLKLKADLKLKVREEEKEFRRSQEREIQNSIELEQAAKLEKKQAAKSHLLELDKQIVEKHQRNMGCLQVGIART
eukprot:TRINITY_DN14694_c0_g2_i1.p2 TRINITY_DN14694_c0_g2~~TRINITY_DN14694_c0_g2_i1.p2  ORF type:complete len:476 (+),score=137.69 TRINITY_DN14694_c0_g2_i1:62-1489(+)